MGNPSRIRNFCKRHKIPMEMGRPMPVTMDQVFRLSDFLYGGLMRDRASHLEHIFCVGGSGYDWIDGRLMDSFPTAREHQKHLNSMADTRRDMDARMSKYGAFKGKRTKKLRDPNRPRKARQKTKARPKHEERARCLSRRDYYWEQQPDRVPEYYPMYANTRLLQVPDDVQADYLAGAFEMIELLLAAPPSKRNDENKAIALQVKADLNTRFKEPP